MMWRFLKPEKDKLKEALDSAKKEHDDAKNALLAALLDAAMPDTVKEKEP